MKLGIWVECEHAASPFNGEEALVAFLRRVETLRVAGLKIESVFLQVLRRGIAYYRSALCESAPKGTQGATGSDEPQDDPLARIASRMSAEGLELHAWINCCNWGLKPSPKLLEQFGATSLIHDQYGTSIQDYEGWALPRRSGCEGFSLDTPGAWIDPSSPPLAPFLANLVAELLNNHATLRGVHLDFIRYPYMLPIRPGASVPCGVDLGLGPALQRFIEATSPGATPESLMALPGTWRDEAHALVFNQWRRDQVTQIVRSIRAAIPSGKLLSAAVLPWADRAYLSAFQDWRSWCTHDLIDAAVLMSYTADSQHLSHLLRSAAPFQGHRSRVYAGIGCYKLSSMSEVARQVTLAAELGLDEAVLFSYGNLRD